MIADIAGVGILKEWTIIRAHAKHSDRQIYVDSRFWFRCHSIANTV